MGTVGKRNSKMPGGEKSCTNAGSNNQGNSYRSYSDGGYSYSNKGSSGNTTSSYYILDLDILFTHPKVAATIVTRTITLAHQPTPALPAARKNKDFMAIQLLENPSSNMVFIIHTIK